MSEKIEQENKAAFVLYSVKCVSCIHLFPLHPDAKSHNSCHFSKGNERCPAQEVTMVVGVDKKSAVSNLRESFLNDDVQAAIEQLSKLIKKPESERINILSKVFDTKIKPKKKKEKSDKK